MAVRVARWASLTPAPWLNGRGVTRQVAAGEGWRVSIADVTESGAFSTFPETDRLITLLAGPPLVLFTDGRELTLGPLRPVAFNGAAPTSSLRDNSSVPTRVLNVMIRRGGPSSRVDIRSTGRIAAEAEDEAVLVVVVSGSASLRGGPTLDMFDAVLLSGSSLVDIDGAGQLAVVRVTSSLAS
jgi:environmental stress-induced protein Ves